MVFKGLNKDTFLLLLLLQIYDGEDNSGSSSIWTQQDRPIYQSSSRHLLIVFKPGRPEGIKKRQGADSWTPTDYPIRNLGFKFNYSFVNGEGISIIETMICV